MNFCDAQSYVIYALSKKMQKIQWTEMGIF